MENQSIPASFSVTENSSLNEDHEENSQISPKKSSLLAVSPNSEFKTDFTESPSKVSPENEKQNIAADVCSPRQKTFSEGLIESTLGSQNDPLTDLSCETLSDTIEASSPILSKTSDDFMEEFDDSEPSSVSGREGMKRDFPKDSSQEGAENQRKQHKRKNIRKVKDFDQLAIETQNAIQQERERIAREQANLARIESARASSLKDFSSQPTFVDADDDVIFVKEVLGAGSARSRVESMPSRARDSDLNWRKSAQIPQGRTPPEKGSSNLSFWDEHLLGEPLHADDSKNIPDSEGRVLVNILRDETKEPPIYLRPKLASVVKPHQIGGIRFMYQIAIESRSACESSRGLGCLLAHAMGLGKTLQVISLVDTFLANSFGSKVMIVAPVNTLANWASEFSKWLGEDSPLLFPVLDAKKKMQLAREWLDRSGVMIIGYETLVKTCWGLCARAGDLTTCPLLHPGPDLLICDEGHKIKSVKTKMSIVLKSIHTRRRICLTGYPLQNNLMEYWCMIDFVRPALLGSQKEFSANFERPITNGQTTDALEADVQLMLERSHLLQVMLHRIVQRRDHSVLMKALPPLSEIIVPVKLTAEQERLYLSYLSMQIQSVLPGFALLSKIWNHPDVLYSAYHQLLKENASLSTHRASNPHRGPGHPQLEATFVSALCADVFGNPGCGLSGADEASSGSVSGKPLYQIQDSLSNRLFEWMSQQFHDYVSGSLMNGYKFSIAFEIFEACFLARDKILIFSQSLKTLDEFEKYLCLRKIPGQDSVFWKKDETYLRLDGKTGTLARETLIRDFNAEGGPSLFLLSTKAGGIGVNLVGANRVIILDVAWNPCHDAQALCRVYRFGQTKHTFIYRFIANGTMENVIYDRCVAKQGLSCRIVDELNPKRNFRQEDTCRLFVYKPEHQCRPSDPSLWIFQEDPLLNLLLPKIGEFLARPPFHHTSLLQCEHLDELTEEQKQNVVASYKYFQLQQGSVVDFNSLPADAPVFPDLPSYEPKIADWKRLADDAQNLLISNQRERSHLLAESRFNPVSSSQRLIPFNRNPARPSYHHSFSSVESSKAPSSLFPTLASAPLPQMGAPSTGSVASSTSERYVEVIDLSDS